MLKNKRLFPFIILMMCLPLATMAQKKLKLHKGQIQYWNEYQKKWTGWPGIWTHFEEADKPVIKISNFGDGDYLLELWIDGEYSSMRLDYIRYNSEKDWHIYKDKEGDEVCVEGSNLGYLSSYGWPSNTVQIYFWLYSEDMAMVFI